MIVAGRGRRVALCRRRPRAAVREPRRRPHVVAQPRALGPPTRPDWNPATAGSASTRSRRGPGIPTGSSSRSRPSASGSPTTAARRGATRTRASCPTTSPRRRATTRIQHCVHDVRRAPSRPERLFMQFHGGVYRSDDARRELDRHRRGAPLGLRLPHRGRPRRRRQRLRHPAHRRRGPDDAGRRDPRLGDARRGRDAGRARGEGLPDRDAYLTVLREAFDNAGQGERSSSTSARPPARCSARATRAPAGARSPTHLPPVHSVRTA